MTAFQASAFQVNAFQVIESIVVPPVGGPRLWRYPYLPAIRRSR